MRQAQTILANSPTSGSDPDRYRPKRRDMMFWKLIYLSFLRQARLALPPLVVVVVVFASPRGWREARPVEVQLEALELATRRRRNSQLARHLQENPTPSTFLDTPAGRLIAASATHGA